MACACCAKDCTADVVIREPLEFDDLILHVPPLPRPRRGLEDVRGSEHLTPTETGEGSSPGRLGARYCLGV